jgi:hypothetical protein
MIKYDKRQLFQFKCVCFDFILYLEKRILNKKVVN